MLEHRACPLCSTEQAENFIVVPDRFALAQGETYALQRCGSCGMIFLNPRPPEAESGRYYQHEEYLPFASVGAPRSITERLYTLLRRVNLRWKKKLLARFHQTGALLDVGCGTGEFLACMRAAGWQVRGLEREAKAAAWGRKQLQLDIQTGSTDDLQNEPQKYNVITMWHVLEHVYDPRAALRLLAKLLREDGVLIVAVPNIASLDAKFYREHWIALDAPRHVNHFTLTTLNRAAAAQGLVLHWWQQLPLDAFFNALMSERLQTSCNKSPAWLMPFRLLRAGMIAAASLAAGIHSPFTSAKHGATIVAVFKKAKRTETLSSSAHHSQT
ncbi:MAG: class I SAM-dependent methyltransferase [candidate division KSB1 bacterium]